MTVFRKRRVIGAFTAPSTRISTFPDGSAGAPGTLAGMPPAIAAGPQFANLLNTYGGFNTRRYDQLAWQPPWNVAGVDFAVGIPDSSFPLKSATGSYPSGASLSGNQITVSGNNVTLDGYDFNGYFVKVTGNSCTIKNCKFTFNAVTYGFANAIDIEGGGTNVITCCEFDGTSVDGATQTVFLGGQSGSVTITYCYFHNWNDDFVRLQNGSAAGQLSVTWTIKYNIFFNGGFGGVHNDNMQTVNASYSCIDWAYNLQYQQRPTSNASSCPQSSTIFRNQDFTTPSGLIGANTSISSCTVICGGDHSGDSQTGGHSGYSNGVVISGVNNGSNVNPTCHDMYFDLTGMASASPVFSTFGSVVNPVIYNNTDMTRASSLNSSNPPGIIAAGNPATDSFSSSQPVIMAAPTLSTATKNGSAVDITGTAPSRPTGGTSGNYLVNVFATDLSWPTTLISAGTVSVAPGGAISLTTSALPAGVHTIGMRVVDSSWNASPLSNTLSVTI